MKQIVNVISRDATYILPRARLKNSQFCARSRAQVHLGHCSPFVGAQEHHLIWDAAENGALSIYCSLCLVKLPGPVLPTTQMGSPNQAAVSWPIKVFSLPSQSLLSSNSRFCDTTPVFAPKLARLANPTRGMGKRGYIGDELIMVMDLV